jgi:predicted lipoprotein with Yx(FWY)xxD motif
VSRISRRSAVAVRIVALMTATAILLGSITGCGSGASASTSPAAASVPSRPGGHPARTRRPDPPRRANQGPVVVQAARTPYGRALTDARGFALYRFTHDRARSSTCYAACAAAWPPYLVTTRSSAAGPGTQQRLLGAVRRADGRLQLTYAGHPLYYYVGDRHPREVLCQAVTEFGGTWYVVARDGSEIT